MRITETQLRQIVRQELINVLNEEEQVNEGFGKALAGIGLAAMLALGYGGMRASEQQAKEVAMHIENVNGDVAKLSSQDKIRLARFHAGASAVRAGSPAEQVRKIEDDAVKSFMVDGKVSEKSLDAHLENITKQNPRLVQDFLQGLKEVK
jgi:hypothetical protein